MHRNMMASAIQQQQHQQNQATANSVLYSLYGGNPPHSAYINPLYYNPAHIEMLQRIQRGAVDPLAKSGGLPTWMDPYGAAATAAALMHFPAGSAGVGYVGADKKSAIEMDAMAGLAYPIGMNSVNARDVLDTKLGRTAISTASLGSSAWTDMPYKGSVSPQSAFHRHAQAQKFGECEPIALIKNEPSSGGCLL